MLTRAVFVAALLPAAYATPQLSPDALVSKLVTSLTSGDSPSPSATCLVANCAGAMLKCALDKDCRDGMLCTAKCGGVNQTCIFQCDSDFENAVYDDMIRCFFTDHDCMKEPKGETFSPFQACRPLNLSTPLATYRGQPMTEATFKSLLTRNGKDDGYWLVARGLSHAYDCFDCQNLWFNVSGTNASQLDYTAIYKIHKSNGQFRWNTARYHADWDMFAQPARMHLHAQDYGGLVHDEDWRLLAVDERTEDPKWVAMYYCGGAPGVKEAYEGSCVMTPDGLMPSDPTEVQKIEAAYTKAGITLACAPNNTAAACAGHPGP